MSVIDGIEYVILNKNDQIRLDTVLTFNEEDTKKSKEKLFLLFNFKRVFTIELFASV